MTTNLASIGASLTLDTTQFEKGAKSATSSVAKVTDEVKKGTVALGANEKALTSSAGKFSALSSATGKAKGQAKQLGAGLTDTAGKLGAVGAATGAAAASLGGLGGAAGSALGAVGSLGSAMATGGPLALGLAALTTALAAGASVLQSYSEQADKFSETMRKTVTGAVGLAVKAGDSLRDSLRKQKDAYEALGETAEQTSKRQLAAQLTVLEEGNRRLDGAIVENNKKAAQALVALGKLQTDSAGSVGAAFAGLAQAAGFNIDASSSITDAKQLVEQYQAIVSIQKERRTQNKANISLIKETLTVQDKIVKKSNGIAKAKANEVAATKAAGEAERAQVKATDAVEKLADAARKQALKDKSDSAKAYEEARKQESADRLARITEETAFEKKKSDEAAEAARARFEEEVRKRTEIRDLILAGAAGAAGAAVGVGASAVGSLFSGPQATAVSSAASGTSDAITSLISGDFTSAITSAGGALISLVSATESFKEIQDTLNDLIAGSFQVLEPIVAGVSVLLTPLKEFADIVIGFTANLLDGSGAFEAIGAVVSAFNTLLRDLQPTLSSIAGPLLGAFATGIEAFASAIVEANILGYLHELGPLLGEMIEATAPLIPVFFDILGIGIKLFSAYQSVVVGFLSSEASIFILTKGIDALAIAINATVGVIDFLASAIGGLSDFIVGVTSGGNDTAVNASTDLSGDSVNFPFTAEDVAAAQDADEKVTVGCGGGTEKTLCQAIDEEVAAIEDNTEATKELSGSINNLPSFVNLANARFGQQGRGGNTTVNITTTANPIDIGNSINTSTYIQAGGPVGAPSSSFFGFQN